MQLTFVVDDALDTGQRKRSAKACEQCKARKKRCTHPPAWKPVSPKYNTSTSTRKNDKKRRAGATNTRAAQRYDSASTASTAESDSEFVSCAETPSLEEQGQSRHQPESVPGRGSPARSQRFIGDLNPETVFYSDADAAGPDGDGDCDGHSSKQNDVGLWVSGATRKTQGTMTPDQDAASSRGRTRVQTLDDQTLPSSDTQQRLIDVYFSKIHPLLPLLDERSFRQAVSINSASPLLVKAICLVASKDSSYASHLGFPDSPALPSRDFCRRIYADLSIRRIEDEERSMPTAIACLALMSLHTEGPDGGERSSCNLMRAIHLAQTVGLHLGRGRRGSSQESKSRSKSLVSLFWALWSLDRINAAVNGRPVMMHERDIGLRAEDSWGCFEAPFRVWLRLAQGLDRVIGLYRPAAVSVGGCSEDSFPGFEDLVEQCGAWDIEQNILVSLEIFHHAVWILSCRLRTVNQNQHPSSNISYLRQLISARQITSILQLHPLTLLPPLPIIPYAVSLSLAVAYKQLRQTKLATTRAVTRTQLVLCSQALEELSGTWWSAETMAKLARQALRRLEGGSNSTKQVERRSAAVGGLLDTASPGEMDAAQSSSSNLCLTGNRDDLAYPSQQPGTGTGTVYNQPAEFQHPKTSGADVAPYPNPTTSVIQQGSAPFDPSSSSLDTNTNLWMDGTDMDEIDAFLGNFLDLRSCAYMAQAHDMEFLDALDDVG